jgi:type IV pilus assembly protein PilA
MSNVKCMNCGLVNFASAAQCRRCQAPVRSAGTGPSGLYGYGQQAIQESMPAPYHAPVNPEPYHEAGNFPPYGGTANGTLYSEGVTYAPPQAHYPAYPAAPAKLKQGLAITSLVIGCVGLGTCFMGFLGAIPGLICGIVAVKKAKQKPMEYGGKGLAIAGIVTNGLMILFIPIIMAIAIPNLVASRQAANEASAIKTVRNLASAEVTYQATTGRGNFGSLEQLQSEGLISTDIKLNTKSGYRFKVILLSATAKTRARFEIFATPISTGSFGTGRRSFYVDETFVIRMADKGGMEANHLSPPIQ